jgi:hypothetical protein
VEYWVADFALNVYEAPSGIATWDKASKEKKKKVPGRGYVVGKSEIKLHSGVMRQSQQGCE